MSRLNQQHVRGICCAIHLLSSTQLFGGSLVAIVLLLLCSTASAQGSKQYSDETRAPPAACRIPYLTCRGIYGTRCYSPAAGQSCNSGHVCGPGYVFCWHGPKCIAPSRGEQC